MKRNRVRGIGGAAAAVVLALAAGSAQGAPGLPAPENSLLGIRLMARFSDVLKKFGQPHEIQVGGAFSAPARGLAGVPDYLLAEMAAKAAGAGAGQFGQTVGMAQGGAQRGQGFGGNSGSIFGARGAGQMAAGASSMGGLGGSHHGRDADSIGGGVGGGGLPGFGGAVPGFGGSGARALSPNSQGVGASAPVLGGEQQGEDQTRFEQTWWYDYPRLGLHFSFMFNKDGHVIQIQEFGWKMGKWCTATRQGVGLGSRLAQVIKHYGWSNDGDQVSGGLTLRYGGEHKLAFQMVRNKVAGITLAMGE